MVEQFLAGGPASDDLTLVMLRRLSNQPPKTAPITSIP
jgi:hypothetical protein